MNWINNFIEIENHNDWYCYQDPCNGALIWNPPSHQNFQVMATPGWEGTEDTPVDFFSNETDYINLGTINKKNFDTFEEYATALQPFLDKANNLYLNEIK